MTVTNGFIRFSSPHVHLEPLSLGPALQFPFGKVTDVKPAQNPMHVAPIQLQSFESRQPSGSI